MGYNVNHKRVHKIYRELNLQKTPSKGYKKKVKPRTFTSVNPSKTNELWSLNIIKDIMKIPCKEIAFILKYFFNYKS